MSTEDLRDDLSRSVLHHIESLRKLRDVDVMDGLDTASKVLCDTYRRNGVIWTCSSPECYADASYTSMVLNTPMDDVDCPVRSRMVGLVPHEFYSWVSANMSPFESELRSEVKKCDCLWCFDLDGENTYVLDAATFCRRQLNLPIVTFTGQPGGKLSQLGCARVRITPHGEEPTARITEMFRVLCNLLCRRIKAFAYDYRQKATRTAPFDSSEADSPDGSSASVLQ